jgi:hypothetical protein
MNNDQVETILNRALSDEAFLARLLASPAEAAKEIGVSLSPQEVGTLKGLSPEEFRAFASEYRSVTDPAKRRAAC